MSRVLILDDEPAVRKTVALCVRACGHEAETSGDPAEALDRLATGAVDLLITDYRMSRMCGLEVVRRLRSLRSRIPVILITASRYDLDPAMVREVAIAAILDKPFDLAQFQEVFLPLIAAAPVRSDADLSH
jgi:CheY-like chemotaxis protein